MTNPPPVAPVEGHYARMRDGAVVGPIRNASAWYTTSTDKWGCWHTDFLWDDSGRLAGKAYDPDLDIIATISPADMQAVASGELERLRAENEKLRMDRGFAIGWITALANNPYKPMTWMQTREAAADCLAALQGDVP